MTSLWLCFVSRQQINAVAKTNIINRVERFILMQEVITPSMSLNTIERHESIFAQVLCNESCLQRRMQTLKCLLKE